MRHVACRIVSVVPLLVLAGTRPGLGVQQDAPPVLEERFDDGWEERWNVQRLAWRGTSFRVERHDGNAVLRADSWRAAAGLWTPVTVEAPRSGLLSWRWKIERTVRRSGKERDKAGDDFAARVFVVFGGAFAEPETRAICYVWATELPVGAVFPSPYTANVATIVVASGDDGVGEWARVERDFVADYRAFFGEAPTTLSGVAVMVDTDNTWSEARTFFDDIVLRAR